MLIIALRAGTEASMTMILPFLNLPYSTLHLSRATRNGNRFMRLVLIVVVLLVAAWPMPSQAQLISPH